MSRKQPYLIQKHFCPTKIKKKTWWPGCKMSSKQFFYLLRQLKEQNPG